MFPGEYGRIAGAIGAFVCTHSGLFRLAADVSLVRLSYGRMELDLTFDAAFSTERRIEHLACVFLVFPMLMQRMHWLRVFAVAAFAAGIV